MLQKVIALVVILYFLLKLFVQKRKKEISGNEFIFWLIFWLLAAIAILMIKKIDSLAADLGFSASGIDILFYLAVVVLLYFVFRLRLRIEKQDKYITRIIREIALKSQGGKDEDNN